MDFENDRFIVKGEKSAVDGIKAALSKRLEELSKYTHRAAVVVAPHVRPHVIGRQGATINRIRAEANCMVDIFPAERIGETKGMFAVAILAESAESLEAAKNAVEKIKRDQSDVASSHSHLHSTSSSGIVKKVSVPVRYHRRLIGPKGSGIAEIQSKVGESVAIQFPRAGTTDTEVEIRGGKDAVEKAAKVISDLLANWGDEGAAHAVLASLHGTVAEEASVRAPSPVSVVSSSVGEVSGPPGWSGRATGKARAAPAPISAPVSAPSSVSPPSPLWEQAPKQEEEWKVIGKKAKASAVEETASEPAKKDDDSEPRVPGAGPSKKKKKSKKGGVATEITTTQPAATVSAIAASDSFASSQPTPVSAIAPHLNWADVPPSPDSPLMNGQSEAQAEPEPQFEPEPEPEPFVEPKKEEDEWQTTVKKFKAKKIAEQQQSQQQQAKPATAVGAKGAVTSANAFAALDEQKGGQGKKKKK